MLALKGFVACLLFVSLGVGCASTTSKWGESLWRVENSTSETPEIGSLKTEELAINVIVTEFREVFYNLNTRQLEREDPTFLAVGVACRNQTGETLNLEANPIQVIGPAQMLVKELPLEHVIYKLYGGELRTAAQLGRLAELREPVPVGSSTTGALLSGIVAGLQASERASIVSEMYRKEASQYQLYYHSFAPAALPDGVATSWTQYYPYTPGPIQVILHGQRVEEGVTFSLPPPDLASKHQNRAQFSWKSAIAGCTVVAAFISIAYFVAFNL